MMILLSGDSSLHGSALSW